MSGIALDLVGWAATAAFAGSYFVKDPGRLRLVQAAAAVMWIGYGWAIGSGPVIGANAIVAVLAIYSARRGAARPA